MRKYLLIPSCDRWCPGDTAAERVWKAQRRPGVGEQLCTASWCCRKRKLCLVTFPSQHIDKYHVLQDTFSYEEFQLWTPKFLSV